MTLSYDKILDHDAVDFMYAHPPGPLCGLFFTLKTSSLRSGYSRIPVHEPGKHKSFIGLLLVKRVSAGLPVFIKEILTPFQLLSYDPSRSWPVSKFSLSILPEAHPTINCFQALDYFQTGRSHLLLLSKSPGVAGGAIGVITLEGICRPW